MKLFFTLAAIFFASLFYGQQPFGFDPTFGTNGVVFTDTGPLQYESGVSVVTQNDGKILVAGFSNWDVIVLRYNTDGTLDNTFGNNGQTIVDGGYNDGPTTILLWGSKIIVGASMEDSLGMCFGIIRLLNDGTPDGGFGINGVVKTRIGTSSANMGKILIQPDDKILAFGFTDNSSPGQDTDYTLVRYNTNGTLDQSFGNGGIAVTQNSTLNDERGSCLLLQPDGKIISAGFCRNYSFQNPIPLKCKITRHLPNGMPDSSFGTNGVVITDIPNSDADNFNSAVLLPNGKILAMGSVYNDVLGDYDFLLVRYNSDGTLDNTFNSTGIKTVDLGSIYDNGVLLTPLINGKIMIFGTSGDGLSFNLLFAQLDSTGTLDNSFENTGTWTSGVNGLEIQFNQVDVTNDGKIVGVGTAFPSADNYEIMVLRFIADLTIGIVEFSTTENTPLLYPNPLSQTEVLKFTLAEKEQISISLFDGQGKLVTTFVENQILDKGDHEQILNLPPTLPNGTYFIQIASLRGSVSIKTIK